MHTHKLLTITHPFANRRVIDQLRACGVLETVRISAAGYPSRWSYPDFLERYKLILRSKELDKTSTRAGCLSVLKKNIADDTKYQFGKTKIFFRAGIVAFLERLRSDRLKASMIMIQAHVRGWLRRRAYQRLRKLAIGLQCHIRGMLARRLAKFLKETRKAIVIQKNVRRFLCMQHYKRSKDAVIAVQCVMRGILARRKARMLLEQRSAVRIQSVLRMSVARKRFQKIRKAVVLLQSCVRRMRAKKVYKQLKIEARSVEVIKEKNFALERKFIELQQKMDGRLDDVKTEYIAKVAALEKELQAVKDRENKELRKASAAKSAMDELQTDYDEIVQKYEKLCAESQNTVAQVRLSLKGRDAELQELQIKVMCECIVLCLCVCCVMCDVCCVMCVVCRVMCDV